MVWFNQHPRRDFLERRQLSTASRKPGQDTRAVLESAGYGAAEVEQLISDQVASEAS